MEHQWSEQSYIVPNSIFLKKTKDGELLNCPPWGAITMHRDFFTHGATLFSFCKWTSESKVAVVEIRNVEGQKVKLGFYSNKSSYWRAQ